MIEEEDIYDEKIGEEKIEEAMMGIRRDGDMEIWRGVGDGAGRRGCKFERVRHASYHGRGDEDHGILAQG